MINMKKLSRSLAVGLLISLSTLAGKGDQRPADWEALPNDHVVAPGERIALVLTMPDRVSTLHYEVPSAKKGDRKLRGSKLLGGRPSVKEVRERAVEHFERTNPESISIYRIPGTSPILLVYGMVNEPGTILLDQGGDRILPTELIKRAGGIRTIACNDRVKIQRFKDGELVKEKVSLKAIWRGEAKDISLGHGDTVCVPGFICL